MKFICPNCGRQEQILVDRSPDCLNCRVKMIPESSYSDCYMSPFIAIRRMVTISEAYGIERARTDGEFKREREAWATAVLAFVLTDLTHREFWIEIVMNEPPDTRLHHVDQSAGYNIAQHCNVEVVDWEEHVPDIMEVIQQKCGKRYPRDYFLLIHARNVGKMVDLAQIAGELEKIQPPPFSEIWIIGCVGEDQMRVARVVPNDGIARNLNLRDALEAGKNQTGFIKRGIRGKEPGFYPIGSVFVPIP